MSQNSELKRKRRHKLQKQLYKEDYLKYISKLNHFITKISINEKYQCSRKLVQKIKYKVHHLKAKIYLDRIRLKQYKFVEHLLVEWKQDFVNLSQFDQILSQSISQVEYNSKESKKFFDDLKQDFVKMQEEQHINSQFNGNQQSQGNFSPCNLNYFLDQRIVDQKINFYQLISVFLFEISKVVSLGSFVYLFKRYFFTPIQFIINNYYQEVDANGSTYILKKKTDNEEFILNKDKQNEDEVRFYRKLIQQQKLQFEKKEHLTILLVYYQLCDVQFQIVKNNEQLLNPLLEQEVQFVRLFFDYIFTVKSLLGSAKYQASNYKKNLGFDIIL